MINSKGNRELCYVVIIDGITPIDGYDRVELAHVGGWTVVVGKGEFKPGDPAIYFEIDSKLPEVTPFTEMEFLVKKHFKVKTQRMCKSLSQGLLMSASNFGWESYVGDFACIVDNDDVMHHADDDSRFLTDKLKVTYAVSEDNFRKSSIDKYKKMAQRNGKLFSHNPFKWLMKRDWGKKLLFIFFGKRSDRKVDFPYWVKKTDEERVQNMPWILSCKDPWIVTEKIDGTSATYTIKKQGLFNNLIYLVCSRNVVFTVPNKPCYYETNVYVDISEKYHMKEVLTKILHDLDEDFVTIQGEIYGNKIQNRDYHMSIIDFRAFNLVTSKKGRWGSADAQQFLKKYSVPFVPILDYNYILPDTMEELLSYADGKSVIDMFEREGLVLRSKDGVKSFKVVSNDYLIKYHN